ncbi:MAG: hypothetical protein KDK64_04175 [Chlamydiia bacterium]|nr:hypothetical protein [Chlamydiia bacterium]
MAFWCRVRKKSVSQDEESAAPVKWIALILKHNRNHKSHRHRHHQHAILAVPARDINQKGEHPLSFN